jgi:hypothetical protein
MSGGVSAAPAAWLLNVVKEEAGGGAGRGFPSSVSQQKLLPREKIDAVAERFNLPSEAVANAANQSAYWICDRPWPSGASVIKWFFWDHHNARLARVAWSVQAAVNAGEDVGAAVRDPRLQIWAVRSRAYLNDEGTLPEQGILPGDLLILVPDDSPQWVELLEAVSNQFPASLSIDLAPQMSLNDAVEQSRPRHRPD